MLHAPDRSSVVRLCLCALLTVCMLLVSSTPTLLAQPAESLSKGVILTIGINDVTEGTLLFKTNQLGRYTPAPILKTDVHIAVTGVIARATVRQEFTNPSHKKGEWLEGIYVFPLPETAAVDHLRMHVGERIIEGQIKERAEAKKAYQKTMQEGKRTSLVEQERPNIFTTSVANIGPGERIVVEIEYQETIRYDQGTFQIRFPMVVGQRYIPGTPVIVEDQDPNGFTVRDGQIVDSRTASIRTDEDGRHLILITCYPFRTLKPNQPFRYVVTADRELMPDGET